MKCRAPAFWSWLGYKWLREEDFWALPLILLVSLHHFRWNCPVPPPAGCNPTKPMGFTPAADLLLNKVPSKPCRYSVKLHQNRSVEAVVQAGSEESCAQSDLLSLLSLGV